MKALLPRLAAILGGACLAGALHASAAFAQSMPPELERPDARGGPDRGPDHGPRNPGRGAHPLLEGIDLSEAQRDRLFAIMHEAAPKRREHDKAQRKAFEALRAASGADRFDDARAAAAAQAFGAAVAAEALLRVRTDAQVMAMLTPQQREQLRSERPARGPRQ
ncbi:Spy/CpxP family protein refolding chaperone [Massilia sp. BKSP1R2A-1]|uniref:Spy/CpxP family protein refolding chaperone n=1 Tax=Massilia sp. BKSP1R2A-1 TaxID=3422595 RepID=UPI003D33191F